MNWTTQQDQTFIYYVPNFIPDVAEGDGIFVLTRHSNNYKIAGCI